MYEKRNYRLIFDDDHGPENYGWYTRHDEYDANGEPVNIAVDNPIGDSDTVLEDALKMACQEFGCEPGEIRVIE